MERTPLTLSQLREVAKKADLGEFCRCFRAEIFPKLDQMIVEMQIAAFRRNRSAGTCLNKPLDSPATR